MKSELLHLSFGSEHHSSDGAAVELDRHIVKFQLRIGCVSFLFPSSKFDGLLLRLLFALL